MQTLRSQLEAIGLSENEAVVMSELVQQTPSSASFLAKRTGLSRSSVYTILSALTAKGLVAITHKNEVKQFIAQDFEALTEFLNSEKSKLQGRFSALEVLRETLPSVSQLAKHVPNVSFFEGQDGLKKVYLSMMRNARKGDSLYLLRDEFVWRREWKFIFEKEWSSRIAKIKADKKIETLLLVNGSPVEKEVEHIYRSKPALKYRFLAINDSIANFATYTIGDTSAIMSLETNNLMGILITNQNVANNHKRIFENLWNHAEEG